MGSSPVGPGDSERNKRGMWCSSGGLGAQIWVPHVKFNEAQKR
jgi:hypothetical protein